MDEMELRSTQKRILTMLLEIEDDPAALKRLLRTIRNEMSQEDIAVVLQSFGREE